MDAPVHEPVTRDPYDLVQDIERITHEAAEYTLQLQEAMGERNTAEIALLDAKRACEIARGKERLLRIALQGANRDLISLQSRLRVIPR